MKTINRLLSFIAFVMLLNACSQNFDKTTDQQQFAAYVSDHSRGIIPADAAIMVQLAVAPKYSIEPGSEITGQVLVFKPAMKGRAYWADERTIQFIPEGRWPSDTKITASLLLNKLLDVPVDFHVYKFKLLTLPLTFELRDVALELQSVDVPDFYKLNGKIITSEAVSADKMDGVLQLEVKGRRHPVRVVGNSFTADSIPRNKDEYVIQLRWNGAPIGSKTKGMSELTVPAKGSFKLMHYETGEVPEQFVRLWFSDFPDSRQQLNGLVALLPDIAARLEVVNNQIVVYPQDVLTGDTELLVAAGLKNSQGEVLKDDLRINLSFGQIKPQVKFTGKSTILAGDSKGIVQFQTIGLKAVDVNVIKIFESNMLQFLQWNRMNDEYNIKRVGRIIAREQIVLSTDQPAKRRQWQTYGVDLNRIIKKEPGALYRIILTFKKEYAILDCEGAASDKVESVAPGPDKAELSKWNGDGYYDPEYYYPDDFDWSDRDDPCKDSYYYHERFQGRNILSSNLGLMAIEKNPAKNDLLLIVNQLTTAQPVQDVRVELFDYQQQSIAFGQTDRQGFVRLKWNTVKPYFAVATYKNEKAYLKLDEGSTLDYTRFDVAGNKLQDGLNGFIFSERGVYRPGDTIHLGFILRSPELLPADYPVVVELFNARNQLVTRQSANQLPDGMCRFDLVTSPEAPTGLWIANVKAGGANFSKRLRVETIKPNRLKINFEFGDEKITFDQRNRAIALNVKWLHGAKAANLDINLEQTSRAAEIKFPQFKNYSFSDPMQYIQETGKSTIQAKTNADGVWKDRLQLPDNQATRGRLQIQWTARVTEPGGDFSTASWNAEYLPFNTYLGIQSPDPAKEGYLLTEKEQTFNIVSVNHAGKAVGNKKLNVQVFKLDWSWWWSNYGNGAADYISSYNTTMILETQTQLTDGKSTFNWTPTRAQWGNFLIRITDPDGGHSTGKVVYVDWPSGYSRNGRGATGGAALLSLSTDKESYRTGETAVVTFSGPGAGKALISIENGSEQLQSWWMDTSMGENFVKIPLNQVYSPNIYVHITLLQPFGQLSNDMPLRSYGIASLMVEDPASRLMPVVKMPAEVNADKPFEVVVSEKSSKPMTYILAIVDEGLLDLTNFKTPDPHSWFYAKEALGLKTWDMYDYVLGAYGGKMEQLFTVGGDESLPDREKARQSRFKPVVRVLGPMQLKPGQSQTHQLKFDNYIGSVKAMVVAVSGKAYGNASATMAVKQPLMVLGTLPRLLRQTDEVVMPVTIFSGIKGQHEVEVNVKVAGAMASTGHTTQKISFAGEGEKTISFSMKAANVSGIAEVNISAFTKGHDAKQKISISVESPNERQYLYKNLVLQKGEKLKPGLSFPGDPTSHRAAIEVSKLPAVNLRGRLDELIAYPYGCTEQITSTAFAQLYLAKTAQLSYSQLQDNEKAIQTAIRQLSQRQTTSGAFSYWPGSSYVSLWADVFATHFLVLASQENKAVPTAMLSQAVRNQSKLAGTWQAETEDGLIYNDFIQAYRLYVLGLAGQPSVNAMNRLREHPSLSVQAAWFLGAAYVVAGQETAARELLIGKNARTYRHYRIDYTFGSELRDKAIQAEGLMLIGEDALAFPLMKELSEVLSSGEWLSTQSTAYALYVWQKFAARTTDVSGNFVLTQDKAVKHQLGNVMFSSPIQLNNGVQIENTGEHPLYLSLITSGIEPAGVFTETKKGVLLNVFYEDMEGRRLDASSVPQGKAFVIVTEVINTTNRDQTLLALSQYVPASWELLNKRLIAENVATSYNTEYYDQRDDKVTHFFGLPVGTKRIFKVEVVAAYEGKYIMPSTRCQAMYNREVDASVGGMRVSVLKK